MEDLAQTGKLSVLGAFCKEVMRLRPVALLYVLEPVEDDDADQAYGDAKRVLCRCRSIQS